jgi:hypothetical protein
MRSRGLYETRLDHSKYNWLARYDLPTNFGFEKQPEWSSEMAVGDIRLEIGRRLVSDAHKNESRLCLRCRNSRLLNSAT